MGEGKYKVSQEWVKRTRKDFKEFLDQTGFPHPKRMGKRGPEWKYPEWLIMFIAVLAVKCKVKSYVGIHQMARRHWGVLCEGLDLEPISERQLRDRLKKIRHEPGRPARFIFQLFPELEQAYSRQC
jgi:hypothetical protein